MDINKNIYSQHIRAIKRQTIQNVNAIIPKFTNEERESWRKFRLQMKNKRNYQKNRIKRLSDYHDKKKQTICICGAMIYDKKSHEKTQWHIRRTNEIRLAEHMKNTILDIEKKDKELTSNLKDTDKRYGKINKYMKYAFIMEDDYGNHAIMKICPDCQFISRGGREWGNHFITNRHVYCMFRKRYMF
mgnify:CR=1 FL=1